MSLSPVAIQMPSVGNTTTMVARYENTSSDMRTYSYTMEPTATFGGVSYEVPSPVIMVLAPGKAFVVVNYFKTIQGNINRSTSKLNVFLISILFN